MSEISVKHYVRLQILFILSCIIDEYFHHLSLHFIFFNNPFIFSKILKIKINLII